MINSDSAQQSMIGLIPISLTYFFFFTLDNHSGIQSEKGEALLVPNTCK